MPTVRVKENEPFEVAMRRFKRLRSQMLPAKLY
jgi:ribosomal protein S21